MQYMRNLSQYIKEETVNERMSDRLSDAMDMVSDYFADLQKSHKNPFERYNLSRSGYRVNVPFGDKKYAALVWEGDDADVLMFFDEPYSNDHMFSGELLKVTDGDYYYRKFKWLGQRGWYADDKGWKADVKKHVEKFLKMYF